MRVYTSVGEGLHSSFVLSILTPLYLEKCFLGFIVLRTFFACIPYLLMFDSCFPSSYWGLPPSLQARIPMGASPHHSLALQRAAEGLPQGWEARLTSGGRVFYINHIHRTTTWKKPMLQVRHIVPVPPRTAQPVAVEQVSRAKKDKHC